MQVITDPAKPAIEVTTGSMSGLNPNINPKNLPDMGKSNPEDSKPAIQVITGFGVGLRGPEAAKPSSSRSAWEPFHEAIELGTGLAAHGKIPRSSHEPRRCLPCANE
jgi:hypothetical protein